MGMTREEASVQIEGLKKYCEDMADSDESGAYVFDLDVQALDLALAALRGPTREMVERMFPGCEYCKKHTIKFVRIEMGYNDSPGSPERLNPTRTPKFCPICGAPMTDEAVDMMLERMRNIWTSE